MPSFVKRKIILTFYNNNDKWVKVICSSVIIINVVEKLVDNEAYVGIEVYDVLLKVHIVY
jgi:hypothetical protein